MDAKESEARAVLDAAAKFADVGLIELDDTQDIATVPAGRTLVSLKKFRDEYRTQPERREGTASLATLDSFCELARRFSDGDSAIFADTFNRSAPKLIAVFDYHRAGGDGQPRFGRHRAVYDFPLSEEWKAWTSKTGPMGQAEFAEFLEDRIVDVMDPKSVGSTIESLATQLGIGLASPQRLLDLSRGLAVRVGRNIVNRQNLSTGETQLVFEEEHNGDDNQPLKVPGAFAIAIPVFRGDVPIQIGVRLRYRIERGSVLWFFSPQRLDAVFDHQVLESCELAKGNTLLPLYFGRPEQ